MHAWFLFAALAALIPTARGAMPALGEPPDAAPQAAAYTLTLLPGSPPRVRVTLSVRGEADGESRLAMAPNWGGVQNCERFVDGLSVRDQAGKECAITSDPAAPHGWNVSHAPDAALVATYLLRPSPTDALAQFGTHYEPVVRNDLLHLIGETGLIYPEWLEDQGPVDITFAMEGFKENGWEVATSFDLSGGRLHCPLHEFRHGMFLAGRVRLHDRDIRGGRLRVAIYGDDWGFTDDQMTDLIERVITVEREFVDDFADPYFLVTVVPTGARATAKGFGSGGTGLTNCFALSLAPGITAGPGSPHQDRIVHLLAHEYFHTWNGGEITIEGAEELAYWFSEGFTDFYASRLLRRAGLIDDTKWGTRLNETLKKFWLSPVATEPATTIQREFWTRREVQELPYARGEVVALMLDEEIRRTSGGARSLDGFFLEVLADARKGEKVSTENLLARVSRWTSDPFAATLRGIVVDGSLPDPPARISEPRASRVVADTYRYDIGFDLDRSIATKVAAGVREGSAAHAAGLRDGQAIRGFDVFRGDPDKEITLTITENAEARPIKFFPRGAPVQIPSYRLIAAEERGD